MRYFSMFSGVGGFEYGIQRATDLSETKRDEQRGHEESSPNSEQVTLSSKQFTCVGFSEIDKYAIKTYQKNFPTHKNYGDATKIIPGELPDFDLLCGGFPCQAFSIAGKRGGFQDTRGTLFFEIARILEVKRPKFILLENVKGLLNHNKGETFSVILQTLEELGYNVEWMVFNSKFFGVPQNRERVFIIGSSRGIPRPEILPFRQNDKEIIGEVNSERIQQTAQCLQARDYTNWNGNFTQDGNIRCLSGGGHSGGLHSDMTFLSQDREINVAIPGNQAQRVYTTDLAPTLKGLGGGQGAKTGLYAVPVLTPDREKKRQNGRRFKEDGEPSFTLTGQDVHGVITKIAVRVQGDLDKRKIYLSEEVGTLSANPTSDNLPRVVQFDYKIRRLTPTECLRLQGFPDDWFPEDLSDSQKYRQMGNAVTTNVISAIIKSWFGK